MKRSILVTAVLAAGIGATTIAITSQASTPVPTAPIDRIVSQGDSWTDIANELAPNASAADRAAFARTLACRNAIDAVCTNDSLTTDLAAGRIVRYLPGDVPGAAPTTTTVAPSTSTTTAPVTTTVSTTTLPPTTSSTAPASTSTTVAPTSTSTTTPATSTTVQPTTTTSAATTTTMAPMTNMPFVDPAKIPGPTARSWTTPLLVDQQYPYQPSDGTGAFRVTTRYSNFGYADPIVYPNGASPHLHLFFGNKCITPQTTDPTTCGSTTSDGGTLNKSGYWVPAIIANAAPVMPADMQVYYKTGYNGVSPQSVKPFPVGLRIVAGDAKRTTPETGQFDSDRISNWECNNGDGQSFNHIPTHAEAQAGGCSPGSWLVNSIEFPQCWDGVNLDSPDHKSHMAYPNGGCPADHPVPLPEITERVLYTVPAGGVPDGWRLSSDNYPYNGSNAGYSGHADWMNGWDPATQQAWTTGCENVPRDCSMDLLGNGKQLGFGPN